VANDKNFKVKNGLDAAGYITSPRLYANTGSGGYFFNDTSTRTAYQGGDFYIMPSVSNTYLYATTTWLGNTSGDNIRVRGNHLYGDDWDISTTGIITAPGGTSTQWNTGYDYSQIGHLPLTGGQLISASGGTVLSLKDSGGAGAAADPYFSYYDSAGVRQGYVGFGSTGNQDLYLSSDIGDVRIVSAGGNIRLHDNTVVTGTISATGGTSTNWNSAYTTANLAASAAGASLTGTPTAPTASGSTNTTQIATTAFVQQELTTLIGGAPSTLNTLNELAAAINDDSNYNSTLTTALATKMPKAGGTFTGVVKAGIKHLTDFESTGHFYLGNNDWRSLIANQAGTSYSATHKGVSFPSISGIIPCVIPIDPEATYRIKVRVKHVTTTTGTGKFYFGVHTLNEDKSGLMSDAATSYNYGVSAGSNMTAGTTYTFEDTFSGYNATNTGDYQKFDPEGKYFNLIYITNYQGSGESVIQSIEVERLPAEIWVGDTKIIDSARRMYLIDGTAALPSISNTGDTNTGIYFSGADTLDIATGGVRRAYFNSAGFTSASNVYTASNGDFRNYGGVWEASTGLTGNGFSFVNSIDGTAMTISSTGNVVATGTITAAGHIITNTSSRVENGKISMEADGTLDWGSAKDYGTLTWDTGKAIIRGQSGKSLEFQTNNGSVALVLDTSQNATFSGNLVVDNGTNTTVDFLCDDNGLSLVRARGTSQGTGAFEVGQSTTHGGGMYYNGDNSPAFAAGETADWVGFYALSSGTRTEVFGYSYASTGAVTFNGIITAPGGSSTQWNTGYDYSQLGHFRNNGSSILDALSSTTGVRSRMIWMRGATSDSVNQINVQGATIEFGQGATLDASPAFKFTHSGILTATGQLNASGGNSSQWNTAYGWGNHASGGYLTSSSTQSKYLRSDTGDSTTGKITFNAGIDGQAILLSGATNFDALKQIGFYSLYNVNASGHTNAPFSYGAMISSNSNASGGMGMQFAHERVGAGTYIRGMNDSGDTWYPWLEVWTSGTDGSGSGLDADLLDGQQGSYYYPASNPSGYTNDQTAAEILTKIKTVDGAGSGLDADLLDGKNSLDFMNYKGIVSGNWDTIFSQTDGHMGLYQVQNIAAGSHSNYPTGVYTYGGVLSWQLADHTFKLYSSHLGDLSFQSGWNNDEYSGWRRILTTSYYGDAWRASTDGAGSGLDADLLDGQQGSYYTNPTSLPANGGNADTVDSLHAASFLRSDAADSHSGGELTFTTSNGIRFSHSSQTDTNDGRIGAGHHASGLNIVGLQTSAGTGRQVRVWGDLITDSSNKYWNAGNDASGSGLDADLLDGNHASAFMLSGAAPNTHTHSYLPLAGGTLTGGLTGTSGTFSGTMDVNQLQLRDRGDYITFYGAGETQHSITSRGNTGTATDDLRINTYGALYVNLDSNSNNASAADFMIGRHGDSAGTISELFRVSGETGNVTTSGTVDGVDISARDAILTSTTTTAGAALPKSGGTMTGDTKWASGKAPYIEDASNEGRIPAPGGAHYSLSASVATGAFKIKLPTATANNSSMITFEVRIFDYSGRESVILQIAGYQYGGASFNWTNHTVQILSSTTGRDYTVRFGNDGTSHCLWIGEVASTWSYPKVGIFNLMVGHSTVPSEFASGWDITLVTAFNTVEDTMAGNLPYGKLLINSVNSDQYVDGSIDRVHLAADIIDGTKIANDVINSEHYVAGSIDNEHMAANSINSPQYVDGSIDRVHLAADIIDGTKIANDVINSEHYAAGSIDNEHIADNAINSEHYADNSIDALHLNVSGNGTTSQYLRSDGDGTMSWVTPPDTNTHQSITHLAPKASPVFTSGITTPKVTTDTAQSRDKLRVWSDSNYTIGMMSGYTFGGLNSDYAMSFQMNNDNDRGFWWGDTTHTNAQGAMSLTTNGLLTVATGARIGYGETDTTIPSAGLQVNGAITATSLDVGAITATSLDVGTGNISVDSDKGFVNSGPWTRFTTPSGYIAVGPANPSWAHIYTDRPAFYTNKDIYVNNQRVFHTGYHPNADVWTTTRTLTTTLTGDVTGTSTMSVNGGSNQTVTVSTVVANNSHTHNNYLPLAGGTMTGNPIINNNSPTVYFKDTDHNAAMMHCNSNLLYVLRGATNSATWTQVNGQWPMYLNLTNNDATFGRNIIAAGNITAYSDRKKKKDIKPLGSTLHYLDKLEAKNYKWISDSREDIGFIAQDVEAAGLGIFVQDSEVKDVDTGEFIESVKSLDYSKMTAVLWEMIRELKSEVDDLKKQIKEK